MLCAVTKHADSFPLRDQDSEGCGRWLGTVYGNIHTGMTHGDKNCVQQQPGDSRHTPGPALSKHIK